MSLRASKEKRTHSKSGFQLPYLKSNQRKDHWEKKTSVNG